MKKIFFSEVKEKIKELEKLNVYLGDDKYLNMVQDLKQTPRSGKLVRIKKYGLDLPCQSIYGHILSMAGNADILVKCLDRNLTKAEINFVVKAIVFHDLSESIIGDVPMFTNKKLSGRHYLSLSQKEIEEDIANNLIANSMPRGTKEEFVKVIQSLKDLNATKNKFFMFLDKSEPIIAIWKYIYFFRDELDIEKFLVAMSDFFRKRNAEPYCFNKELIKLVSFLQNKKNAREYYLSGWRVFEKFDGYSFSKNHLKLLIESKKMYFVK